MERKNDDLPLNIFQYAMLRVAHQADLSLQRELTARKRAQCLFFVRLGERVLRTLEREQIASPDLHRSPAAARLPAGIDRAPRAR